MGVITIRDDYKMLANICKLEDEWYCVYTNPTGIHFEPALLSSGIYKCDQIEGVIKLLKDKFV